MLKIIEKTKIVISISLIVIILGIGFMFAKGLNFGIDFKGGSVVSINLAKNVTKEDVAEVTNMARKYAEDASVNTVDSTSVEIKSSSLDSDQTKALFNDVKGKFSLEDNSPSSEEQIGSAIGKELSIKSIIAVIVASIAMLIYIAIRFEFKFGVSAIIALIHDVLITLSIYSIFQLPVNSSFIAAMLTIIGYSMNDTIVIFDRIRENLRLLRGKSTIEVADISITETIARSINTSMTTLITIISVYVFVPTIRDFTFPLIIGIASGAYSSIFIASPMWVLLKNKKKKLSSAK
jgi:preprotein translocase SecF subunit